MGKDSAISWTHHTFNGWWGCVKVSEACRLCYAETFSKRVGKAVWGADAERRFFGDKHWAEPLKWDREARKDGIRHRVFAMSMADVFEARPELDPWRAKLYKLIEATPWLDWLLLTKRHAEILPMTPDRWHCSWPTNVWPGVTVETQKWAEARIPELLRAPSRVRWLSCEPLLGPLDLRKWLGPDRINWVIVGGESGHGAKPMEPEWVKDLIAQCREAKVPFHFKQKGNVLARKWHCASQKGDDPAEWPEWMRIQEFPA